MFITGRLLRGKGWVRVVRVRVVVRVVVEGSTPRS